MRILFLSRWYPYPPDNGSKIRVHGLLRGLCERHEVTLISFRDPSEAPGVPPPGGPVEIRLCDYREFRAGSGRALAGLFSRAPRYLIDTHSAEMERLIGEAVRQGKFDLVIASQLSMAAYHRAFRGVPAIFEEVELGAFWPGDETGRGVLGRLRRQATWAKHHRYVARLLENFVGCTVASEVERQLLALAAPGYSPVHVVPNSVDTAASAPVTRDPRALIFTGSMRFAPNRDAMTWFLDEILPAVRAQVPDVRVIITGEPGPVPFGPVPGVTLAGYVPDVRAMVAASAVSLAPIRAGGGTRLKILEAMAARTPVVATSKAAEGIDARHGEHLLVADTPAAFAAAVCRLLEDPSGAARMAERAWQLCRDRYDARVVASTLVRLAESAAAAA
ncbi:MAG: glycosyltransferase [Vicinamibacterales bacterium]